MKERKEVQMTFPLISLNGSGRAALKAQALEAYRALSAAAVALSEAMPHGRDYPSTQREPYGTEYRAARAEMEARIDALQHMKAEMVALARHIDQAGK